MLDIAGFIIGVLGIGWAIYTEWNAEKERGRMHSFLKGLRVSAFADPVPRGPLLAAINDEMARLQPPKKQKASGQPEQSNH